MSTAPFARGRLFALSVRWYRTLLIVYPRAFRREFGLQMAQVFRDCCRQAQAERGALGVLSLLLATARDLAVTGLQERVAQGVPMPTMSRPRFVRAAGAIAMLGGALNLISFVTHPHGLLRAIVPGSIVCLIIGVAGLHALLWGREGWLGWLGFVLVGVGLMLGLIGMAGSAVGILYPNPAAPVINTGEHAGLVFIGAGMLLWGVVALRTKALGRWSVLPLVLGLLGMMGIGFLLPDAFAALESSVMPQVFAATWILFGLALLTELGPERPWLEPGAEWTAP